MLNIVEEIKKNKIRVVKSCALYSCSFMIGIVVGIVGPTLIDLAVQTGTDLTKTSLIIPLRACGYMAGSFACSIIYDRVNILLNCIFTMSLSGLMALLVPLLRNIWVLLSSFVIMGFALGVMEASVNVYIIHLWGKEVTPFLQALNFFFGLGALLSPLFTKPFILPIEMSRARFGGDMKNDQVTSWGNATVKPLTMDDFTPADLRLIFPYALIALYAAAVIIFLVMLYIYVPVTDPHPSRLQAAVVKDEPSTDLTMVMSRAPSLTGSITSVGGHRYPGRNRSAQSTMDISSPPLHVISSRFDGRRGEVKRNLKWYQVQDTAKATIIGLFAAFILVYHGLELTYGSFLAPFAVSSNVHMDTRESAQLASIFWAAFTFWRLFTILYIGFTGPQLAIILNLAIIAVGAVIIVPWGFDERWALYSGTVLIGVGISPLWGTIFGFLESQFPVSSHIASYLMIATAAGELIFPVIISNYMDSQPIVFIYLNLFCSILVIIVFAVIVIVCRYNRRK